MRTLGIILSVAGLACSAWFLFVGPLLWLPAALIVFGVGAVLYGLGAIRDAVDDAAHRIVVALSAAKVAEVAPRQSLDAPPDVSPTPHPSRRRPTFEELTEKRRSDPTA